jgi:hypothetical protein
LGFQQLEQPSLGLLIEGLDEGETLRIGRPFVLWIVPLEGEQALAGSPFKVPTS